MALPDPGSLRPRRSRLSTVLIIPALVNGLLGLKLKRASGHDLWFAILGLRLRLRLLRGAMQSLPGKEEE